MNYLTLEHCVTYNILIVFTACALTVLEPCVCGAKRLNTGYSMYSMMLT